MTRLRRVGILDQHGTGLGGAQVVAGHLARILAEDRHVELLHFDDGYSLRELEEFMGRDLSSVEDRVVRRPREVPPAPGLRELPACLWSMSRDHRRLTAGYDLFVWLGPALPPVSHARRSVVYCHFPLLSRPRATARERDGKDGGFPRPGRSLRSSLYEKLWTWRFGSYDRVLANSEYTARWIRERWQMDATVLYPPVHAEPPAREKENLIVTVGRFDARDPKRQDLALAAFREFLDRAPDGWRLVLLGATGGSRDDRALVHGLRKETAGMPAEVRTNVPRAELLELLAGARLFWHLRGLGEVRDPAEREHFGIATVEAMRAGCVPVVPASGGQPEIVRDRIDGYLCGDLSEVVEASTELATDEALWTEMSERARRRSQRFSTREFRRQLQELLASLEDQLSPPGGPAP